MIKANQMVLISLSLSKVLDEIRLHAHKIPLGKTNTKEKKEVIDLHKIF